jgi:hypothetical protein
MGRQVAFVLLFALAAWVFRRRLDRSALHGGRISCGCCDGVGMVQSGET